MNTLISEVPKPRSTENELYIRYINHNVDADTMEIITNIDILIDNDFSCLISSPYRPYWTRINNYPISITSSESNLISNTENTKYVTTIIKTIDSIVSSRIYDLKDEHFLCPFCFEPLFVTQDGEGVTRSFCVNINCGRTDHYDTLASKLRLLYRGISEEDIGYLYYWYKSYSDTDPEHFNNFMERFAKNDIISDPIIIRLYKNMSVKTFLELCGIPTYLRFEYMEELEELNTVRLFSVIGSSGNLVIDQFIEPSPLLYVHKEIKELNRFIANVEMVNRSFLKAFYLFSLIPDETLL